MKQLLLSILSLSLLSGCVNLDYKSDLGFMPSAFGNSPEYLLKLNGTVCKDTDGFIGFCAKRIKSNQDLVINIIPQQYAYTFQLDCTDTVGSDTSFDVLAGVQLNHVIPAIKYQDQEVFNCTVDILPHYGPEPVAAFAAFRIMVVNKDYISLDSIVQQGRYIVMGRHSYLSNVGGKEYKEKPFVVGDETLPVIVQSYSMRFSYRGL